MATNFFYNAIKSSLILVVMALWLSVFSESLYAATLIGHYQFDVCSNAALGDDTLNARNGSVTGSVALNKTPPAGGKPQTCSAANFSGGAIDVNGLPVSTTAGDKTSVSFWMYWDGSNSVMPIGWERHDLWFYNGSFGFNSASGDLYGMSSAGLQNGWHHVVAVFTNGDLQANKLYIDGVAQALNQIRGTPNNASAVVNSHFRIGGWWTNNGYRFTGHLDEVKIYNGELSPAEINADFTYANASCVVCPPDPPPVLIGHYQFNACHSSDLGKDTLGVYDGVNSGGVIVGITPPAGKPETCTDGVFAGGAIDINGLPVSANAGDKTSVSFWMHWDGVNNVMPLGWNRYDLWFNSNSFGFNTSGGDIYGISSVGLANSWHHVAVVFTNGNVSDNELYIDGVKQTLTLRRGSIQNNNAVVDPHLRIGGWWSSDGYRFAGRLDEVKVYRGKITQSEVDADRAYTELSCTHCPPPPPAELKAYYSFNEGWTSQVRDVIGNYNGTVSGNISRVSAGPGGLKGDTCYAAAFNGGAIDINGLPLSTNAGEKSSISFWMHWNGTNSVMPLGFRLHDLWFSSGHFGFNSAGGDIYGISSAGLANGWHHIAAVFTNGSVGDNTLYLDGVKQTLTLRRGSIRNNNAYVNPHLRLGGWWANNGYRFRGNLDDVKVYSGEVSEAQVLEDMLSNGCLIAEWRMDEASWDGTMNEVGDNTSNGYHGTSFNGVNTLSAVSVGGGICRVGQFADNGYVESSNIPHMTDSFSMTAWFNTNDNSERGQRIFVDDENNNIGGYAISVGDPGTGRVRFYHRSLNPVSLDTANHVVNNRWYFVAATLTVLPANQAIKDLYLYDASGTLLQHVSANVNNVMQAATGNASIGGEVNGSGEEGNRFDGYLDEVKIFSKALGQAEIVSILNNERTGKNWDGTSRTCSSSCALASLNIVQSGNAVACPQNRASVSITARCADNSTKTDYSGTVNLSSNRAGSEFYETISGGSAINSIQFAPVDNGIKTIYLYHNQEEPVQVTATDTLPNPDIFGIGNSTDFRAFGFTTNSITAQTACEDSSSYQLTAIGKFPGNAGCDVIENFSGTKNIKAWFDYANPSSNPAGNLLSINGNTIPTSESSTTALDFNNGRANYALNYPDAGQLRLHFKYDVDPYDGDPHQAMLYDSNLFVVKPEKLHVYASDAFANADVTSSCAGTACTKFKQSEEDFYLTVQAACADNRLTPNFNYSGRINLSSDLKLPAAGVGNIAVTSFNDMTNGQEIINQNFNDAGIITIGASLSGPYLGESLSLTNQSDWIGRFYPAYFDVTSNTPAVQDACASGTGFTYMGQAFGFLVPPELTITAMSLNDNIVNNYSNTGGDNFWKLALPAASGRSYADLTGLSALNHTNSNSDDLGMGAFPVGNSSFEDSSAVDTRANAYDGHAVLTITGDYLKYSREHVAPFNSKFQLTMASSALTDSDGVCYKASAVGACLDYSLTLDTVAEQRMGRLQIQNAYGSELRPLAMPLYSEYYTGTGFVVNVDDGCTAMSTSDMTLNHTIVNGSYSTTATFANHPFSAGLSGLSFSAPGVKNTGYTDVQVNAVDMDQWLLYDWDNDGSYDDAPSGRASFGHYDRSKRLIYIRETY